jgi:hypothetical protein
VLRPRRLRADPMESNMTGIVLTTLLSIALLWMAAPLLMRSDARLRARGSVADPPIYDWIRAP